MRYLLLPHDGPLLSSEADAVDLVGLVYGDEIETIAIPLARLAPDFWHLGNRKAGLFIQKLLNYRLRPAFVGSLQAELDRSAALRDYVLECRRRRDVIFCDRPGELDRLP